MRVLITGYSGFAGSHLTDHLLATTDWHIWGTVFGRRATEGCCSDRIHELPADLRDPEVARAVIREADPDVVFHLAGEASVHASWQDPWAAFETNVRMQFNLHQALETRYEATRFLVILIPSSFASRKIWMISWLMMSSRTTGQTPSSYRRQSPNPHRV